MRVARLGRAEDVVAKVWTVDGRPVQQSTERAWTCIRQEQTKNSCNV